MITKFKEHNENYFGHDDDSEIFTVIKKLQKEQYVILDYQELSPYDGIFTFKITVSLPSYVIMTTYHDVSRTFTIKRKDDKFYFKQLNGKDERLINKSDGYIIWSLLEEMYDKQ